MSLSMAIALTAQVLARIYINQNFMTQEIQISLHLTTEQVEALFAFRGWLNAHLKQEEVEIPDYNTTTHFAQLVDQASNQLDRITDINHLAAHYKIDIANQTTEALIEAIETLSGTTVDKAIKSVLYDRNFAAAEKGHPEVREAL
jgi:hypothetical protein